MKIKPPKKDLPQNVDTSGIEIEIIPYGKTSKELLKFTKDFNFSVSNNSRKMRVK